MHWSLARRLVVVALFVAALIALPAVGVAPIASAAPTPCADLAVSNFSISPATPIAGQQAQINFRVTNNGTCSTNTTFVVQWKQTLYSATGPSTSVGPLAKFGDPGYYQDVTLNYTFPAAGNFLSLVTIDTNNAISETNEVNNLAIYSVSVLPSQSDLVVTGLNVTTTPPGNPMVVGQGLNANAAVTVRNNGNTAVGQFQVAWQPTLTTPALTATVPSLAANTSTTVNFVYNYSYVGSFYTKATVDSTYLVPETNEFNNSYVDTLQVLPALSDLDVTGITFNPTNPVAGQNVHVTVSYANIGFVSTGQNSTVSWKPGPLIAPLSATIGPVAANSSGSIGFDYIYAFGGSYATSATVDSNGVITELLESNNKGYATVNVASANVDLTITNVSISPSTPQQGVDTTVTVTVQNNGNDAAGPFVVSWNPDAYGILVPGVATLTQQVPSLAGNGATTPVVFHFSWPQSGPFHTIANVDAFNTINETNESNNLYIKDLTVSPGAIDLTVTGFTLSPSPAAQFGLVTATITVKNIGSLPVSWFQVEWKSVSTNISGVSTWVPGLNPGESTVVTLQTWYFNPGTFTSKATVDPMNLIPEPGVGAESNNSLTTNITINPLSFP